MSSRLVAIAIFLIVSFLASCIFRGSDGPDNNTNNTNNEPEPELCGNGRLDLGETCDPCDAFSCPTEGCNIWVEQGSAETCDLECVMNGSQTACGDGDSCCPEGCDESNDSDCSDACGNDVIDEGEVCDPCPDACPQSECAPVMQTGDPSTCDLSCEADAVPLGCCGGGLCPDTMVCVEGACVEPGCEADTDCTDPNERCIGNVCTEPQGCTSVDDCLPWETCADSECITPEKCEDAPDQLAYCAYEAFQETEPGRRTKECTVETNGLLECALYMPRYCADNTSCEGWETCVESGSADCLGNLCCVIPDSCSGAKDQHEFCVFKLGRLDAICDQGVCL